jgi:predicted MFS family arabinose efflux permease
MPPEIPKLPGQNYQTGGWKAHWILIVCTLLYMVNYIDRSILTVVLQPMKLDLGLSDAETGLTVTVFTLSMAVFSFPIAYIVDRWSRKKAISLMAFIWSVFTLVTGLAKNFAGVLLPRAIVGTGEAGFTAGGVAMMTAAYPQNKHGRILGIFNVAIPLGTALGTVLGGMISVKLGWRAPFFVFAVPGILLAIAALFLKDYKTIRATGEYKTGFVQSILSLLRIPSLRWYYVGYGIAMIMLQAQLAWTGVFIMRELGVKEDVAGLAMGALAMLGILGGLAGGFISDAWYKKSTASRLHLPAISTALAAVFMFAAINLIRYNVVLCILAAGLYVCIYFMAQPALGAVSQEVVPPAYKGLSLGLAVFCMYMLGGAWSPWLTGVVSDSLGGGTFGLETALSVSCVSGLLSGFCYLMGSRHYEADESKIRNWALASE